MTNEAAVCFLLDILIMATRFIFRFHFSYSYYKMHISNIHNPNSPSASQNHKFTSVWLLLSALQVSNRVHVHHESLVDCDHDDCCRYSVGGRRARQQEAADNGPARRR